MSLSAELVRGADLQYKEEVGAEQYTTEIERLASLPEKFENRTWSREELDWIVVDWKMESFPPGYSKFPDNDTSDLERAIDQVLRADSIRGKVDALADNNEIIGVGVAVASAILLFIDPERYTVIDRRAWNALHRLGYVSHVAPETIFRRRLHPLPRHLPDSLNRIRC